MLKIIMNYLYKLFIRLTSSSVWLQLLFWELEILFTRLETT